MLCLPWPGGVNSCAPQESICLTCVTVGVPLKFGLSNVSTFTVGLPNQSSQKGSDDEVMDWSVPKCVRWNSSFVVGIPLAYSTLIPEPWSFVNPLMMLIAE